MSVGYIDHRRNGYGQHPMLAAHGAGALIEHRYDHLCDVKVVETYSDSSDVDDGVHRSHLMEMHLFDRQSMGFALCLCDNLEYPYCQFLCPVGECAPVQYLHYVSQTTVLMVMIM